MLIKGARNMDRIRILILEDDEDIIDLLRSLLEPDYDCYAAANGLEGLQLAIQGQPDLIICDIMMPVMDGWEFIKRLRGLKGFEEIPVIILSALGSRQQIRDGYDLGAALYLTKPINPSRLKRNIEMFIGDHKIEAQSKRISIEKMRSLARFQPPSESTAQPGVSPASAPAPSHPQATMVNPDSGPYGRVASGSDRARILVVEDDPDSSRLIRAALEDQYEMMHAGDGIAAIEMAVRYKPDIFIIDGMLPKMTGYQLTMMLKKNRLFFRSPIIFISGKATQRDKNYVERLGVQRFLAKPFKIEQLIAIIKETVSSPDFEIHKDRIDAQQVNLENLQHLETHRSAVNSSSETTERRHGRKNS